MEKFKHAKIPNAKKLTTRKFPIYTVYGIVDKVTKLSDAIVITIINIILLTVLFVQVVASLNLYAVEFVDGAVNDVFSVEGVITIPIGGSSPIHYAINCMSSPSASANISWSRADRNLLTVPQIVLSDEATQLDLQNAGPSDLAVYICYDGIYQDLVTINVTDS